MQKHTPGPWEISGPYCLDNRWPQFIVAHPRSDASLAVRDGVAVVTHFTDGTGAANARLIAAAPDLAAAGIEIMEVLGSDLPGSMGSPLGNLRAALKKAGVI